MKRAILISFIIFFTTTVQAQKVGLVFSGGGAKGLAHIGVLKALEENNIPIDYIVGTSMGGIIGGMYAAGYSPSEIEYVTLSKDFQNWVSGRFQSDYRYFYRKKPDNPSVFTAKFKIDSAFQTRIRSNLVNDIPLNFALLELLAQSSANARDDFNKLFVPFRCIVADIFSQKMIPVNNGSLAEAIRGTFAVPFIYRPVKVGGQYVFDGGLYDNFPVDVMKSEFTPDYIIGANVSFKNFNEYPKDGDEKLLNRFLVYMFLSKSDSTSIGENGSYIQPDMANFSSANFTPVEEIIKSGYDATMANMPNIKKAVSRRVTAAEVKKQRLAFKHLNPDLTFNSITATGINSKQKKYIESVFKNNNKEISLDDVKKGYYKLVADDNFETVYPRMNYEPKNDAYGFELQVQPQKNFKIDFGGVIASRPVSNVYLGLQYNYLRTKSYTISANFYSGRFYESAQSTIRVDVPTRLPFYLESEFTYNYWNYFNDSQIFVEKIRPAYIKQSDRRFMLKAGIPVDKNGKIEAQAGYIVFNDRYSPNNEYKFSDILDYNRFNGLATSLSLEKNTLNVRQYANKGLAFQLGFSFYHGVEDYIPGNIFRDEPFYDQIQASENFRNWFRIKLSNEHYVISNKFYSLGYLLEGVISNKPVFNSFKSTLLSTPAFYPLQDSKSIYLEKLRANNYAAFGIKNIFNLRKNLDLRLEAFIFQPLEEFKLKDAQSVTYNKLLANRHYAAAASLVYSTIAGPVGLSFNHYDDDQKRFGVLFHIGFLMYNKRAFE